MPRNQDFILLLKIPPISTIRNTNDLQIKLPTKHFLFILSQVIVTFALARYHISYHTLCKSCQVNLSSFIFTHGIHYIDVMLYKSFILPQFCSLLFDS